MSVARITRQRSEVSPGLIALCAIVAILVVLPIVITTFQAFQGGTSAISDALGASSSRTLLRNTVLVSLVATPISGVIGVGAAWFVERTRLPAPPALGALAGRPADRADFRHELRVGDAGRRAAGVRRCSRDHRVHLLPDRLPAGRRLAARPRSRARRHRALARAQSASGLLPCHPAAASPGAARRPAARGARCARRVRCLRRPEVPDVLPRHLRAVPPWIQHIRCRRAVVLLDRPLPRAAVRRGVAAGRRELHQGQPRRPEGSRPLRARSLDAAGAGEPCRRGRNRRRHPGRHAHPLVYGKQQCRTLDRDGESAVSLARQSHDDPARCLLCPRGTAPGAAGRVARGAARGAFLEARRTLDVPLLRATRSRGGDRSLLRSRSLRRGSSTGASR